MGRPRGSANKKTEVMKEEAKENEVKKTIETIEKPKLKLKVTKITKRISETKNIGNYESLRIENELEVEPQDDQTGTEIEAALRKAILNLNKDDFDKILGGRV